MKIENAVLEWTMNGDYVRIYEHGDDHLRGTKSSGAVYTDWNERTKSDMEAEMMADVLQAIVFDGVNPGEAFWELQKVIDFAIKIKAPTAPKKHTPDVKGFKNK